MPTTLQKAQTAERLSRVKLRTAETELARVIAEHRVGRVKGEYDAVTDGADKRRRTAKVERTPESGIITMRKRLKSINLARNLLRNFTSAKAIDHQRRVNVVGTGPKLKLHLGKGAEEDEKRGQDYFNNVWAKDCDSRDDVPWNEEVGLFLSALGTDGGCLVAVDDWDRDDGKLITWSTDQMVTINANEWKAITADGPYAQWIEDVPIKGAAKGKTEKKPMQQHGGFVWDLRGRVMAYVVTAKPGKGESKLSDVTILERNVRARMIKRPWRLNQLVPVPEYLTMVADLEDLYEGRTSALQTWKKAAKIYAYITSERKEDEALTAAGNKAAGTLDDQSEDAEADSVKKEIYDALDEITGGYNDYMDEGDVVNIPKASEKSDDKIEPFFDHCLLSAGASVGLARAFTTLKAQTSYTAFRGETVMTWTSFRVTQKLLERRGCDWIAVKVLTWAQKAGKVAKLPAGWENKVAWEWPKMQTLDPAKEYKAIAQALKLPVVDWADLLGPDWKRKLQSYKEQLDVIKALGLNHLSVFETVAGAPVDTDTDTDDDDSTGDDDNDQD